MYDTGKLRIKWDHLNGPMWQSITAFDNFCSPNR